MTGWKLVFTSGVLIASAATIAARPGFAGALPQSQTQIQLSSYGTQLFHPAKSASVTDGIGTASVDVVGPSVSSSVVGAFYTANPYASLTYFFEVTGPSSVSVGIHASGTLADQVTPGASSLADSYVEVYQWPGFQKVATIAECALAGPCTGYNPAPAPVSEIFANPSSAANNYDLGFSIQANTVYEVLLGAETQVHGGSGYAYADPFISIDPSFLAGNSGYGLLISPEITQTSAVPEPKIWFTLVLGLAVTGAALRRRGGLRVAMR